MDLFGQNFDLLQKSLDGLSTRHKAISSNIANVDTPGYKRRKVNFKEQLTKALDGNNNLAITDKSHISLNSRSISSVEPKVSIEEDTKIRSDGNNVSIDAEMANLAKNTLEYQATIKQLSNQFGRLNLVIKKGGK
ncbi:flagellar basal-body rod protein FlgB [Halobacteroides halobius DSM 5150]|uniref:Flagellar basal body rod protein FlgB n=1 Tax=Halobacteroides halobius (strain ATCC 35273 / DSM 5150 / MD-1) TaxID=748449 RepID=L0K5R0_HALHC|nr:flagellar basal body rod protein FlgB [Halobacteroides halobius]AGB40622.1 flagellar basal-body rod protein FlgB [Halobacteroides halobius DSM 5150]